MMHWLTTLFLSGWIAAIAILVLWMVTTVAAMQSATPALTFRSLVPNAVSGSALLTAFGVAIRDGPVPVLAVLLTVSLVAFLVDLRSRLGSQASGLRRRTE